MQLIALLPVLTLGSSLLAAAPARVSLAHQADGPPFAFPTVPFPARNDVAATAVFTRVDGQADPNGGPLAVLNDGCLPEEEDQPGASFFFRAGTAGGRVQADLQRLVTVRQINTFSWHAGDRGPQVYRLYGADGTASGFRAAPPGGTDPASCGWTLVATVDTRPEQTPWGGQYGVSLNAADDSPLGTFRYLLWEMARTEDRDAFGNTFYSELDVVESGGPALVPAVVGAGERVLRSFTTADGRYRFTLDVTAVPDLVGWVDTRLQPVVQAWYPRLVEQMPGPGFQAATNLTLRFREDLGGTPAAASGRRIDLNAGWFRRELDREALGAVVHELVHVVQNYGRVRPQSGATRTPGWVVEGIADYFRWFVYEPQTQGAAITARNLAQARYDASYRISANFLNWVVEHHDRDLIRKLNAAAREGTYAESRWAEWTGRSLTELGEAWKAACTERVRAMQSQ